MSLNTPTQTFSNVEDFFQIIVDQEKTRPETILPQDFEFTDEEKNFLISEMEKYSNQTVKTAEVMQMLDALMTQKFDENRKNILGVFISTRIMTAINEKQIQKTTTNVQNNVNGLL